MKQEMIKRLHRIRNDVNAILYAIGSENGLTTEDMIRREEMRDTENARRRKKYAMKRNAENAGQVKQPEDPKQMILEFI